MTPRVAIIGAGISGLSCARPLAEAKIETVVFEKSRSFGGRCASRLWNGHVVDHGAPYFTMRDPDFAQAMRTLCGDRLRALAAPLVDGAGDVIGQTAGRFYHLDGNNRIGRALADGLDVRRETLIEVLERRGEGWLIGNERFDQVVVTVPWPQAARLIGAPETGRYAPCLTAFFAYEGVSVGLVAERYAVSEKGTDLMWSACENHKEGRIKGEATVFVAHASPAFSEHWLEAEPAEWLPLMREKLEEKWQLPRELCAGEFAHRWRFARALDLPTIPALEDGLWICGDSVTESRIEDVWLSGRLVAAEIIAKT